jgi:hypothetical protein
VPPSRLDARVSATTFGKWASDLAAWRARRTVVSDRRLHDCCVLIHRPWPPPTLTADHRRRSGRLRGSARGDHQRAQYCHGWYAPLIRIADVPPRC